MKKNSDIKRITFTHRKGGSRTLDKDGNEIKEQETTKTDTEKDSKSDTVQKKITNNKLT